MKPFYFKLRSFSRVAIKHMYYRMIVPMSRLAGRQWIDPLASCSIEISSICNFNCVFCAYQHTPESARSTMSNEDFARAVDEVTSVGITDIGLTPLTGDLFVDKKGALEKLRYLDEHDHVLNYSFTTNLSLLTPDKLDALTALRKLGAMKISVYGHDEDSFEKITQTHNYQKFMKNLTYLRDNISKFRFTVNLGIRSYMDFNPDKTDSALLRLLNELAKSPNVQMDYHRHYTNWGGYVKEEDLKGLPIILKDDKDGYKSGPCARLFAYMVLSNSDVILCACRDALREMVIGNVKETSFKDIISLSNPRYAKWINDQEKDQYNSPCKDCDMYRPVYGLPHYELHFRTKREYQKYDEFFGADYKTYINKGLMSEEQLNKVLHVDNLTKPNISTKV